MGLEKAIASGKEHRQPYRQSKAFDPSCRNHGGCPWCEGNRLYQQHLDEIREKEETLELKGEYILEGEYIWESCEAPFTSWTLEARDRLISQFKSISGFEGCGVGKTGLVVVVADDTCKSLMPREFDGIPVKTIVTGGIRPL